MCGLCGVIQREGAPVEQRVIQQMNDTLTHRGPDGAGYHVHDHVALAMRRLSIIDVAGSDQPLYNEDDRCTLVFNGEIYNYQSLRRQLVNCGHHFRTAGDGETIVHSYEEYGAAAPTHLRGQFAFALWDADAQQLFLARDRFGQKPLYYYHADDVFVFASEIKALLQHPAVPCESAFAADDGQLLALYLGYGYVPAPLTAFRGIRALPPAHTLTYDAASGEIAIAPFWELPRITDEKIASTDDISHYVEMVRDGLRDATELRMIADVPLGAFLSGGLDSSLIVALMQQASNQQVKTFSIGFAGDDTFDETAYAEQVAQYLDTDHTAFTVQPDAMDLLPKLVYHHDQPFADSSAIPTYLVSDLTRQQVTVALTGDGGDELFAGYERFYAASLVQQMDFIPKSLWKLAAATIGVLPEGTGYYDTVKRAGRFARGAAQDIGAAYFDWVRVCSADLVAQLTHSVSDAALNHFYAQHFNAAIDSASTNGSRRDALARILEANQTSYLPDDLLIKADRCSMAASLEARAPFLDHQLAELVAPMPFNLKLKGSTTKYLLKEAARGILPDAIIDRRKHGFGIPLGAWLREDMSPVRDLLLSDTARQRGLLDMATVERLIDEHAAGTHDHNRQLWTLLTLEEWHRQFID